MRIFIKIFIPILISICMCFQGIIVFAESTGDPNIDSGGGGMGSGTSQNFWSPSDDGVRITVVDAETGEKKSQSIDYTNKQPSNISLHFGNVCKTEYIGGRALSPQTGGYSYMNPSEPLPAIVGDGEYWSSNIDQIRSYFTDEQVVSSIAGHMGFTVDDLTNGDYKLMIEPVIYITYNGTRCALTATEMALYNQQTNGDMKRYFADLSHKNLPLEDKFGKPVSEWVWLSFSSGLGIFDSDSMRNADSVGQLNEFALAVSEMSRSEFVKFKAVLEAEQPESVSEAINISAQLDDYEFDPSVTNFRDYGEKYLSEMLPPEFDRSFLSDGVTADFGRNISENNGSYLTEYGMLSSACGQIYSMIEAEQTQQQGQMMSL